MSLEWNQFGNTVTSSFKKLKDDTDFSDVTLACDDGEQIEAHKVVLITSSPFFMEMLKRNKHTHPLIYMRGVKSEDLVAMIDFFYDGETSLLYESLESFIDLAKDLEIESLHEMIKELQNEGLVEDLTEENISTVMLNQENSASQESSLAELDISESFDGVLISREDLDRKVNSMITTGHSFLPIKEKRRTKMCNVSGCVVEGTQRAVSNHIENTHIQRVTLCCDQCDRSFSTRNALSTHISRSHKI